MSTNYDDFIINGPAAHTLAAQSKFAELQQATTDKIAELQQRRLVQEAREKAVADSVVGKLGLNPNNNVGALLNRGVATFTGIADGVGAVGSGAASELARFHKSNASMQVREAYLRQQLGKSTPEDLALLDTPAPGVLGANGKTNRNYLDDAEAAQKFADKIDRRRAEIDAAVAPDIDGVKPAGLLRSGVDAGLSLVNSAISVPQAAVGLASLVSGGAAGKYLEDAGFRPAEAKSFMNSLKSAELQASNQSVNGAEGFWKTLDQVAENPSTVPHLVLESLFPMLAGGLAARGLQALGAGVKLATAAGEGITMAGSAAEQIRGQTEDKRLSLKQSLAAATTGVMGGAVARLSGGVSGKLGLGDIDEAITKGTLGTSQRGVLTRTGGATAFEGGEEALQSTGETVLQNFALDKALTEGVGNAAALGMVTGAAMGAPVGLAKGVGEAKQRYQDTTALQNTAIATGDVTALADPAARTYAPERAIAALTGNAQLATTTEETKQAHLTKADEISSVLEVKREGLATELATNTLKGVTAKIAQMQERLANTDPAKTQLVTAITTNLATLQEQLVSLQEDKTDGKRTKALEKEMAALDMQIEGVNTARTQLNQLVQSGTGVEAMLTALSTLVDQADPVAVEASVATATRVVNLAMSAPQLLDPVRAEAVAADMTNALTAPQREVLREFSKARLEQNLLISTGGVSLQIYKGGSGNVGIEQYQQRMDRALKAGNVEQAQKQLDGLGKFEASHRSKAEVAAAAMAKGPGIQIINANGQWKIGDGSLPQSKMRPNGALTINLPSLVSDIQQEAAALTASLSYLTKAYELKFNVPAADASTLTGAENVTNQSQQGQGTQVQSETSAAKDVAATGSTTPTAQGVPAVAGATGGAQADGVTQSAVVDVKSTTVNEETSVSSVKTDSTGADKKTEQTQKIQSTEKTADTTVETQSNSENSTAESGTAQTVGADGKLSAIQQTSPEGTPHNEKKLGDFFTQETGKDTDGSIRPLVAVKNFMAAVAAGTVKVSAYIKDQDLSKGSKPIAWAKFVEKTAQWAPIIARNLKVGVNEKFNYTDPMRYLIQVSSVNGKSRIDVEENVKTAMSAAVFGYIADLASRAAGNSDKAINSTLGHRPDSPISADARAALTDVGAYQSQVIDSLGSAVIAALGFKIDVNAPQDMLAKLQVSLGAHAFKLMEDRGLLVRTSFTNGEINTLRNEDLFADNEAENQAEETTQVSDNVVGHHFFKLARDEAGQPDGEAKEIADSIKGSQSLIQNLFGIESGLSFPSLTPLKGVQKQSATGMGLPGFVKRVFKLNQTRPWKANKDPLKVLSFFSEEDGMEMAGVQAESEHTHVRNRNSKRAKNDGLIREFRNVMGFFGDLATGEKGMDQEFFLSQDMWKQQRSGYKTNTVNPNTSKIVRWLIAPDSWSTVIDLNNEAQFQSFMLRASEGFGIKPEKAASQKSVKDLDSMMQDPAMKAAVKALQAVLFTDNAVLSAEQQGAIKAAVKTGNQKLHTLASLIAYANYQQAIDTKATTFTTNLMGEVDGVSNGSILNAIMYGAAATSDQLNTLLQKGGIYALSSKFQQYNLWRGTPSHQDIYESNAQDLHAYVNSMPGESRTVTDAIWATAGSPINAALEASKDGRDLLKGPINPLNYGGGFTSIIGKMAYDYVDAMYEKLEGFSRKGSDQSTVDVFVSNVNVLLSSAGAVQLPVNKPISYYLSHSLSKSQEAALRNAYSETIGAAAKEVVGTNFKPFLKRSKLVTQTANLAYGLYEAVYTASRDAMVEELGIPRTKAGPIHDLSKAQEAELAERLKDILPAMHTAMSKDEGNISSGILLAKKGRKQNNSAAYKVEVTFGSKLKNNASQLTSSGRSVVQEDPGVIAISGTTHALDSAISLDAQRTNHVVNNHDAVGAGINTLATSADSLNKSTWTRTLNYSPLNEAHDALMRVVQGIVAMDQRGELTPEIQVAIKEMLQKLAKKNRVSKVESLLDTTVFGIFNEALAANKVKFGAMSQWAVIDQYAMDGGSYTVTKEDRKEANDRFNALSIVRLPADLAALDDFAALIFGAWAGVVRDAPVAQPADAPKKETLTSVFGPLGTPKIAPDADLVAFFEANPEASFKRVLQGLLRKVSTDGSIPNPKFHNLLVKALVKLVDPELKVKYITKDSPADLPINGPVMGARGWFAINGTKQEIYVLSPDFVDSGLTTELLIHELVHAALSKILQSTDAAVQPFIAELNALLKAAETAVNGNAKLKAKFGNAVANLDELLSWGMTNQAFQMEVLAKINMQSTTLGKMVNGLQVFVANLANLLGFKDVASADGLGVLIANVSALFAQVATENSSTVLLDSLEKQAEDLQAEVEKDFSDVVQEFLSLDALADLTPEQRKRWEDAENILNTLDSLAEIVTGDRVLTSYKAQVTKLIGEERYAKFIELRNQYRTAMNSRSGQQVARNLPMAPVVHTVTAALKRWFGASKVVDVNGNPLVVYHGTPVDIDQFDTDYLGSNTNHPTAQLGFFFSADPAVADMFISKADDRVTPGTKIWAPGANVVAVYLNVRNPKIMTAEEFQTLSVFSSMRPQEIGKYLRGLRNPNMLKRMFGATYDGVLIKGDPSGSSEWQADTWVAFKSTQIKSAIGNSGAYDGSNPRTLAMAAPSLQAGLNKYSTLDLHDALKDGKLSVNFANQVRGLLSNIVEKLHGPFGSFSASLMKDQALSAEDVWLKALNTGEAPFASQILGAGFVVPDQSMFAIEQIEVTVRAALDSKEAYSTSAYKTLDALYTEVSKKIKVEDFHTGSPWSQATTAEQAAAQALHDFVFKLEGGVGQRSDYLSRFAAMGLAHEGFNKLLQVATDRSRTASSARSFADRLQMLFESILAFWNTKVTGTYKGQQADQKLTALVGQLVDIEAKRRYKLAHPRTNPLADSIEDKSKAVADALRSKISKLAGAPAVTQNSNAVVRAAGALVQTVVDNRVEYFMDNLRTMRNSAFKGKLGVIASALGELQGPAKALQALLRASKWMEGHRKDVITNTAVFARAGFVNKGKGMSEAAKASISQVFLRAGLHYLVGKFSMAEIASLVSSTTELNKAIAAYEAKLNSFGKAKYYFIEQANALGIQVATGGVRGEFEMMNAHNIASLYGTAYQGKLTEARITEAKEVIEVLVALYALGYTDSAARLEAGNVMVAENQRTDGNGVESVLKLHKQLEKESIDRLFKGRPELMMHGYLPEIYDPNIEVKVANAADGKDLINLGYTKGEQVVLDRADPDRAVRHMYVRDGGGMGRRITGITSWKSLNSKGTENHSGYTNTNTFTGAQNAAANADLMASRQQAIADMFQPGLRRDLSKVKANHMAPVLNERGDIVKWRYLMSNTTKDSVLNRDNRFDQLLGSLAGATYDKETSREQNKTAFEALKAQYDADYAKNPQAYVLVGQGAVDKNMKEIWDLLPADSKADAQAIWGYAGMMVKNDALDIVFGYRKASLAHMFEKDPVLRNALEKVFVGVMETVLSQQGRVFKGMTPQEAEGYAKRAAIMITRGEKVWQELVSEVKDILVVKTGLVMMGNIYSNLSLLWLSGVPIKDILRHHLVALQGATAYRRDSDELAQLKLLRDTGYMQGKDAEVTKRIARLENDLARNPVKELIDLGLMPTIVEDLAADEDIYSYKSDFVRSVSKFTDKLNPKVVSAARTVYMAHDTQLYQGLSRVTQLSDFVARYTLYQHNISKRNPMTKEEAIQDASDAFINYDIPMHQSLQYMDDMGLLPFTKYFLRIQKVLGKLFMDNPGRVLMAMSVGQLMDLGPIVLESSMYGRIGNNPLDVGPFKLFTVMDDIATINAALTIVK